MVDGHGRAKLSGRLMGLLFNPKPEVTMTLLLIAVIGYGLFSTWQHRELYIKLEQLHDTLKHLERRLGSLPS